MKDLKITNQLAAHICNLYGELSLAEVMAMDECGHTRSMMNMMLEALDVNNHAILALYQKYGKGQSAINRDWSIALLYYRDNGYFRSMFHHIHQQITAANNVFDVAA